MAGRSVCPSHGASADRTDGYPLRHWEVVRSTRRNALKSVTLTGGATLVFWLAALRDAGWLVFTAVAGAVFLLVLLTVISTLLTLSRDASIHPYFERAVGETDTFCHGHALAREFMRLDALAAGLGVIPLSTFGFADDLAGEELVWHDAADGLRSFRAVLEALERDPERFSDPAAARADLERVVDALEKAEAKGIRFCLLLRHSNFTSGQEWAARQGTAF